MTATTSPSPARVALEGTLERAELRRAEIDRAIADLQVDRDAANERVIELETALADLGRLEGPLFHPSPKLLADQVIDELETRAARR